MGVIGEVALRQFGDMEQRLFHAIIIEHRPNNKNIVGRIEYSGVNGGGRSFGIGWQHIDGGNRTTLFDSFIWEMEIVENVIFIRRVRDGEDGNFDAPWPGCVLYTIFVDSTRR